MSNPNKKTNFLIIMSDEHGPMFSSTYGHPIVQTPNMDLLAQQGITFESAYCNAPLCVPSRASFMTSQYGHRLGIYDNNCPLSVDVMTWPYWLRSQGYDVVLSGKMHLIGPDYLHGFREQLAEDIHLKHARMPEHFWGDDSPNGIKQLPLPDPLAGAGSRITKSQSIRIEGDIASEAAAIRYLKDPNRSDQPWALCVGFIAPHFPFVVPEPYFYMYYPANVDLPNIPEDHLGNLPPAAKRLRESFGIHDQYSTDEILRARAAYYGQITWMDEKIGNLYRYH